MADQKVFNDSKGGIVNKESQALEDQSTDAQTAPPPLYTGTEDQSRDDGPNPPSYDKTAYPPLPHHAQAPSRTLYVWYESWRNNDVHILDADHATTLYEIKLRFRKPQMTVTSAATKSTIATVDFSLLSRGIETTINGASVHLTPRKMLKIGHTWSSPALGNTELTWKFKGLDLICEDKQDVAVARITFHYWSLRKSARVDIYGPDVPNAAFVEEIFVTGLAVAEYNAAGANISILPGGSSKK